VTDASSSAAVDEPFRPWRAQRILARQSGLLVVDKPSGIPTHGGEPGSDVVSRLKALLSSPAQQLYLGVHQRLDLGTSGVLAFCTDEARNKEVADAFASGGVRKRYVAAVELSAKSPLSVSNELELRHLLEPDGRLQRVTKRGGKPCVAHARVLRRVQRRALVELRPQTGRTHQLRVQLAAEGAAIAGDTDYAGAPAARLLLHAASLSLLGHDFVAEVPASFERWLEGREPLLGARAEVARKLSDAACLRYPLIASNSVLRWVNGVGDELPGVEVDWYDGFVSLAVSSAEASSRAEELAELLHELGARGVYLKQRAKSDLRQQDVNELAPPLPVRGEAAPSSFPVNEGALRVNIELGDGLSTGLFVDQRDNRRRLSGSCHGQRVLNLFSYTCSFSVAAALGGAARVVSVDLSKRALRRGEENFRLSGLDPGPHAFIAEDAVRYLERTGQRGDRFDWIVLDPPSFSTSGKGKVLRVAEDYERLVQLALSVLADGGRLLAVTNHRGTSEAALHAIVQRSARALGRRVQQVKSVNSGVDCPAGFEGPHPSKAVLLTLG